MNHPFKTLPTRIDHLRAKEEPLPFNNHSHLADIDIAAIATRFVRENCGVRCRASIPFVHFTTDGEGYIVGRATLRASSGKKALSFPIELLVHGDSIELWFPKSNYAPSLPRGLATRITKTPERLTSMMFVTQVFRDFVGSCYKDLHTEITLEDEIAFLLQTSERSKINARWPH